MDCDQRVVVVVVEVVVVGGVEGEGGVWLTTAA